MFEELLQWGRKLAKEMGIPVPDDTPADRVRQRLADVKNKAVVQKLPVGDSVGGHVRDVEKFVQRGDLEGAEIALDNFSAVVDEDLVELQRLQRQMADVRKIYETNKRTLNGSDGTLAERIESVKASIDDGNFKLAATSLKDLGADIQKRLEQDAHGNVRELANKEDAMVKKAIETIPVKAKEFQKGKFSERMAAISGMPDVNWDEMIGEQSNAFDVISQMTVFDKGKDKLTPDSKKISYLDFQNAMYGDEPGSRKSLVLSFYDKKLKTLDKEAAEKLTQAVESMKLAKPQSAEETEAINKAFAAMDMKGVRPKVEEARNEIKNRLFLAKNDDVVNRGRVAHTLADTVLGFAAKALTKLQETDRQGEAKTLSDTIEQLKQSRKEFEATQRESIGFIGKKQPVPEEIAIREKTAREEITAQSTAAFNIMKKLDLGLDAKGWETAGGIGSDDGPGGRDVHEAQGQVFMGKNVNTRDEQSAASDIFRELGIPFTGGASGSTVDAVGGIVDAMLGKDEDAGAALKDEDPRKAKGEAEICMYIMGMHTAGHHSLVEMLYAAKQYPQKFFTQLRDPITDWTTYQKACSDFLQNDKDLGSVGPNAVLVEGKLDEKASGAKRYEAMTKAIPEDIITHDACTKAFMKHAESVVGKL